MMIFRFMLKRRMAIADLVESLGLDPRKAHNIKDLVKQEAKSSVKVDKSKLVVKVPEPEQKVVQKEVDEKVADSDNTSTADESKTVIREVKKFGKKQDQSGKKQDSE